MVRNLSILVLKPASSSPPQAAFSESPECKRDLATALLQQNQILDRRLGGLYLGLHASNLVGVDFSDRNTERVIHPGCAAGQLVDECLRPRRRDRQNSGRRNRNGNQLQTHQASFSLI